MSPSGKAPDFDSGIRRFKSCHPSHQAERQLHKSLSVYDPLAQLAEQLPFKQWVRSSNLRRVTKKRKYHLVLPLFAAGDSKTINATVRWTVAATSSQTGGYNNFCLWQKCYESPADCPKFFVARPGRTFIFAIGKDANESHGGSPFNYCLRLFLPMAKMLRISGGSPLNWVSTFLLGRHRIKCIADERCHLYISHRIVGRGLGPAENKPQINKQWEQASALQIQNRGRI